MHLSLSTNVFVHVSWDHVEIPASWILLRLARQLSPETCVLLHGLLKLLCQGRLISSSCSCSSSCAPCSCARPRRFLGLSQPLLHLHRLLRELRKLSLRDLDAGRICHAQDTASATGLGPRARRALDFQLLKALDKILNLLIVLNNALLGDHEPGPVDLVREGLLRNLLMQLELVHKPVSPLLQHLQHCLAVAVPLRHRCPRRVVLDQLQLFLLNLAIHRHRRWPFAVGRNDFLSPEAAFQNLQTGLQVLRL
mmetsp:Transcript_8692/g.19047  ORF Transcript_8692/g.19047 Transcript_8692/m.19047 type:complete len:252 (+) Transcript_8692:1895-2650(+)